MSLSILVPYVPLQIAFLVLGIVGIDYHPYNYNQLHSASNPFPWNSIMLIPSWMVPFSYMNQPWIAILTTIPIVLFFGMTKDGIAMYQRYALRLGLGRIFPQLKMKEVWEPGKSQKGADDDSNESWFKFRRKMSKTDRE
jgi:pheromone a factor receptor